MLVNQWDHYLAAFKAEQTDLYFTESYGRLYERNNAKAKAFVYTDADRVMVLPVILAPIPSAPGFFDFETPYGYGGPIANTGDTTFLEKSFAEIRKTCLEQHIVAGFIRFHPLLENHKLSLPFCDVRRDRMTVAMDLTVAEDRIWNEQIHAKNRNVIRKAGKAGLEFLADEKFTYLDDFKNLYHSTMNAVSAADFYYFDDQYFDDIRRIFGSKAFLGIVRYTERIISAALFLRSGPWGHYHLAGSDRAFLTLSPNNFLLYQAALKLKADGVTRFHLGGGTDASETNSLLMFKRRFSNDLFAFHIGRAIFMPELYAQLCQDWERAHPELVARYDHLLLKYRLQE